MSTIMEAAESLRAELDRFTAMAAEPAPACIACAAGMPCNWHRADLKAVADHMQAMGEADGSIAYWLGELPVVTPPAAPCPPEDVL